jgi:hypothetical protein
LPLSIRTDGEPSARFPREADFRRGGNAESGRRTGTARINAAKRRTASAASSGARGVKSGSASSISWSTSSRGACYSRSRLSGSASGRISSIWSLVGLRVSSTSAVRGRGDAEGAKPLFPPSSRGVPEMQRNSRGGVPPSSDRIPVQWLLRRGGGTRRGLERRPSGRCHSLCPASSAPDPASGCGATLGPVTRIVRRPQKPSV